MDNNTDIIELLDILYGMVTEAWGVPLGNDKCIIEREKAVDIINEIKANLPSALAEAKRLVSARDEFIGNAKREAEAMRKSAEEKSKAMIEEQEVVRVARARSAEMISAAEAKSKELRRVAAEYVDEIMKQSEASVGEALAKLQSAHSAFNTMGGAAAAAGEGAVYGSGRRVDRLALPRTCVFDRQLPLRARYQHPAQLFRGLGRSKPRGCAREGLELP